MEVLSFEQFQAIKEATEPHPDAKELALYIENDGVIYRQRTTQIIDNLKKKVKKGDYDAEKALKLWSILADEGAKKYDKQFGSKDTPWNVLFPKAVRNDAAKLLRDYYEDHVKEGE
jgi:hypothetical protein